MAYDTELADRVRHALAGSADVVEQPMFGGLAFMIHGHMGVGVLRDDLIVRTGEDGFDAAMAKPHVRPFDFTGRPARGMVYVAPAGTADDEALRDWVRIGAEHSRSLPPKAAKKPKTTG
jgi:hypothetical protein